MSPESKTERLRQEKETFDIRSSQCRAWFVLRYATMVTLLVISFGVFLVGAYILLWPANYPPEIVAGSGVAIMLDFMSIAGTAITHTLRGKSQPVLAPVTGAGGSSRK